MSNSKTSEMREKNFGGTVFYTQRLDLEPLPQCCT